MTELEPREEPEEFLTGEEISGVPVLDSAGSVVGVASKTDIVRALSQDTPQRLHDLLDPEMSVEDIMTRDITTVTPDTDVSDVARLMIDSHMHRVLVLDGEGMVGIITAFDLLKLPT